MTTAALARCLHLGGVLLQHADGVRIKGRGLCLQVGDGAVGLDGQDGVGGRHVHRVLDVGGAAILQLHLLQAALVIGICAGKNREFDASSPAALKCSFKYVYLLRTLVRLHKVLQSLQIPHALKILLPLGV